MIVKKYNISKPKKYMVNGAEKTQWNTVGTMTEFIKDSGEVSRILEIPAIGLEASIFPMEPRPAQAARPQNTSAAPATAHEPDGTAAADELGQVKGDMDVSDIPF